jgi:hypothetical protein
VINVLGIACSWPGLGCDRRLLWYSVQRYVKGIGRDRYHTKQKHRTRTSGQKEILLFTAMVLQKRRIIATSVALVPVSAAVQTFIFRDHKLRDVNVGETTTTELLSVISCILAAAGTLYDKRMMIAEERVSCDFDV